jgi:hypothetical protein
MKPQLSIEAIWHDQDVLELLFRASNGRYSGTARLYIAVDGDVLFELAENLRGFPKRIDQVEEGEFGTTRQSRDGFLAAKSKHPEQPFWAASVHLKFLCIDNKGHTAVNVTIQEDAWHETEEAKGSASFQMSFEAAHVDSFADELIQLCTNKEGMATLDGIYDGRGSYLES